MGTRENASDGVAHAVTGAGSSGEVARAEVRARVFGEGAQAEARTDASHEVAQAADQLACAIVDEARVSLGMAFRYLDAALWRMPTAPRRLAAPLATDGARLYVDAVRTIVRFRANPDEVARDVLHAVLHCILRHPFAPQRAQADVWARACDIAVESMALDLCAGRFPCEGDEVLAPLLDACAHDLGVLTPAKLYRAGADLAAHDGAADGRPAWAALFAGVVATAGAPAAEAGAGGSHVLCARDSHELWGAARAAVAMKAATGEDAAASTEASAAGGARKAAQRARAAAESARESQRKAERGASRKAEGEPGREGEPERESAPKAGHDARQSTSSQTSRHDASEQVKQKFQSTAHPAPADAAANDPQAAASGAPSAPATATSDRTRAQAADRSSAESTDAAPSHPSAADATADREGTSAPSDEPQPTDARHVPGSSPASDAVGAPAAVAANAAPAPSVRPLSEVDPAALERSWEQVARTVSAGRAAQTRQHGDCGGAFEQNLELACRTRTDYADFLKRFATVAEDQRLSPDEFDYVYYAYGLRHYGNLPLIEPLEYQERRRVREFVIAIDTSGSTQGDLVRAFVTRTYEILHAHEQFGDVVNIHLIQADARIQSDTVVRSVDELDRFARTMPVRGGGGTDFRPVFAYVERLRAQGAFRNLQGLVYFTDGWGTFPDRPPAYDVAFVFVEEDGEARWVPPWAMRVVMDEDQVRDLGRGAVAHASAEAGRVGAGDERDGSVAYDIRAETRLRDVRVGANVAHASTDPDYSKRGA